MAKKLNKGKPKFPGKLETNVNTNPIVNNQIPDKLGAIVNGKPYVKPPASKDAIREDKKTTLSKFGDFLENPLPSGTGNNSDNAFNMVAGLPGQALRSVYNTAKNISTPINTAKKLGSAAYGIAGELVGDAQTTPIEPGVKIAMDAAFAIPTVKTIKSGVNTLGNKFLPNAYKVNPFAFKPQQGKIYRQVGKPAKVIKELPNSAQNFNSEIDWAKWNKEIPENAPLMKEYNAIEQTSKANGSWMKNLDGSKFEGTPEQFVQQNSSNFKKAFGNSKLVNADGSPKIIYHGTRNGNLVDNEFKAPSSISSDYRITNRNTIKDHNYFTPNKQSADGYANSMPRNNPYFRPNPKTYDVYANIENPYLAGDIEVMSAGSIPNINNYDAATNLDLGINTKNKFAEVAIPYWNKVKSATGNNGMFDMANPNIYKAVAPVTVGAGAVGAASQQNNDKNMKYGNGGIIKRADGSYSQRGLWDNIRANKGSGKEPTKEMLKQERKINAKYTNGGRVPIKVTDPNDPRLRAYNDSLNSYNITKKYAGRFPLVSNTVADRRTGLATTPNPMGLMPIGWYERPSDNPGILPPTFSPAYKKPVQPVVYEKPVPVVKKPVVQEEQFQPDIVNTVTPQVKTKFYQGYDFMQQTGLKNGDYSEQQVQEAMNNKGTKKLANKYGNGGRVLPKFTPGGTWKGVDASGNAIQTNFANSTAGKNVVTGAGIAGAAVPMLTSFIPDDRITDSEGNEIGYKENMGKGILNSATEGASMGAIAGPWGAVIGAGAGAIYGGIKNFMGNRDIDDAQKQANIRIQNKNLSNKLLTNQNSYSVNSYNNDQMIAANGGTVINEDMGNPNAELELNETFRDPMTGETGMVDGPSHDNGGIEMSLNEGTQIWSDRLKHNGRTFASLTKPIINKISNLEKGLDSNPNSRFKQNSIKLLNAQLDFFFNVQESNKQQDEMKRTLKKQEGGVVDDMGNYHYANGGIYIKPENRNKFGMGGMVKYPDGGSTGLDNFRSIINSETGKNYTVDEISIMLNDLNSTDRFRRPGGQGLDHYNIENNFRSGRLQSHSSTINPNYFESSYKSHVDNGGELQNFKGTAPEGVLSKAEYAKYLRQKDLEDNKYQMNNVQNYIDDFKTLSKDYPEYGNSKQDAVVNYRNNQIAERQQVSDELGAEMEQMNQNFVVPNNVETPNFIPSRSLNASNVNLKQPTDFTKPVTRSTMGPINRPEGYIDYTNVNIPETIQGRQLPAFADASRPPVNNAPVYSGANDPFRKISDQYDPNIVNASNRNNTLNEIVNSNNTPLNSFDAQNYRKFMGNFKGDLKNIQGYKMGFGQPNENAWDRKEYSFGPNGAGGDQYTFDKIGKPTYQEPTAQTQNNSRVRKNNTGELIQAAALAGSSFAQLNNINRQPAPGIRSNVRLTGAIPNPRYVDLSAERGAINRSAMNAMGDAQRSFGNSASAQAFKNKARINQLEGAGKSYQAQENLNSDIYNKFAGMQGEAAMKEALVNNEIENANLENRANFNRRKMIDQNTAYGTLGHGVGDIGRNRTIFSNDMEKANVLSNQYEDSVLADIYKRTPALLEEAWNSGKISKNLYDKYKNQPQAKYGGTIKKRSLKY